MGRVIKLAAALCVGGLLALTVPVCSYAAGWTGEDGAWSFYDESGRAVADQWKKSGDDWYWLDSQGVMAANQIVEYDGDYYYVGDDGVMVTNQWVRVENDEAGLDAASGWWYYFQASGKACKAREDGRTSFKTINGKRHAFADDGKMLFGWVDGSSTRRTDDDAWASCMYYLGDEDDGAAAVGWRRIHVIDGDTTRWDREGNEGEDQDYWFYFQPNGKKLCAKDSGGLKTKTINGSKYSFDETGRMAFEWTRIASASTASAASSQSGGAASASVADYYYFQNRDDGARVSQGWFKVIPDEGVDYRDSASEEARWFYAYGEGKLCASQFRNIDGKRYCFDNSGGMLTGLQAVYTDSSGRVWNRRLDEEYGLMMDATSLVDGGNTDLRLIDEDGREIEGELKVRDAVTNVYKGEDQYGEDGKKKKPTYGVYYFGGEDDGAARVSDCTVKVDGEEYSFAFSESGSDKGKGWNGLRGKYLYQEGRRVKADKENKYEAYFIAAKPWQKDADGKPIEVDSQEYQDLYAKFCFDEGNYFVPGHVYYLGQDEVYLLYIFSRRAEQDPLGIKIANDRIYLVNTRGSISGGTKAVRVKDGIYQLYEGSVVLFAWSKS